MNCRGCLLGAALAAMLAAAADPYVGYVYPCGLTAGTTNRFLVGGQNFWNELQGWVSGAGVHVLSVSNVPGMPPPTGGLQRKHVVGWLDGIARGDRAEPPLPNDPRMNEWRRNAWWEHLDRLGDIELAIVERDIHVPKNGLQMTPSLRQMLIVTIAADADAVPGARDLFIFGSGGISAPHRFFVSAAPHHKEPLYVPPHRQPKTEKQKKAAAPKPVGIPVVFDGQILPGETDAYAVRLEKDRRFVCRVRAREMLPYVGDAVPGFFNAVVRLLDRDGKVVAFADDQAFLPDPVLACTVPASGDYTLEIRDNLYRGREDFVYLAECVYEEAPPPARAEAEPAEKGGFFGLFRSAPERRPLRLDEDVTGVVSKPGAVVEYAFEVEPPARVVFDLAARRDGSPLDGALELVQDGRTLARWDDVTNAWFVGTVAQAECDPRGEWDFKAGDSGKAVLRVYDTTGKGGADYAYRLSVRRRTPHFAVHAARSSLLLRPWSKIPLKLKIERHEGFTGPITLVETPEIRFENAVIPAESNQVTVTVLPKLGPKVHEMRYVQIWAVGEVAGKLASVRVTPADEQQQAFAWTHLVPAEAFACRFVGSIEAPAAPDPKWPQEDDSAVGRRIRELERALPGTLDAATLPDGDDGLLLARLALSVPAVRGRRLLGALSGAPDDPSAARRGETLVLAGANRLFAATNQPPRADAAAVRLTSYPRTRAHDADLLVWCSETAASNYLASTSATAARRLQQGGWAFDVARAEALANVGWPNSYRAVLVPKNGGLTSDAAKRLLARVTKEGWIALFEGDVPNLPECRDVAKALVDDGIRRSCNWGRGRVAAGTFDSIMGWAGLRREAGLRGTGARFVRYRENGGGSALFISNRGTKTIAGPRKFSARVRSAAELDPATGETRVLDVNKDGLVTFDLAPGASRWIVLSTAARAVKRPKKPKNGRR